MTVKVDYLLALLLIVLICFLIYRLYLKFGCREDEPEQHELIDCRELMQDIDDLHKMMQKLAELDSAIIDLDLCRPAEQMRNFRVEWQGASGAEHAVDFMADGESTSHESFKAWAVNERIRLNQDIAQRIYDLYAKASYLNYYSPTSENPENYKVLKEKTDENSVGEWLNAD